MALNQSMEPSFNTNGTETCLERRAHDHPHGRVHAGRIGVTAENGESGQRLVWNQMPYYVLKSNLDSALATRTILDRRDNNGEAQFTDYVAAYCLDLDKYIQMRFERVTTIKDTLHTDWSTTV